MFTINNFSPSLDSNTLYSGIDFSFLPSTITCILGPSGSGKTSLLRALSGKQHYTGQTNLNPELIFNVYQNNDQLLPWYSIRQNLDLACDRPWQEICHSWKLDHLLDLTPNQISVGQKQRFTLLRAICNHRPVIFCDEPLSAVDGITARSIADDFRQLVRDHNKTCLWITHNLSESAIVSERALVIAHGSVSVVDCLENSQHVLSYF